MKIHFSGKFVNKFSNFINLITIVSILMPTGVLASINYSVDPPPPDVEIVQHPQTGVAIFLSPTDRKPLRVLNNQMASASMETRGLAMLDKYGKHFGLDNPSKQLKIKKQDIVSPGKSSIKFQQVHNGIPILAGEIIVNMADDGRLISINGEISPNLAISIKPRIVMQQARILGIQVIAKSYGLNKNDLVSTDPELWIFDERLLRESTKPPVLVWRMEVSSKNGGPINELVLINAETGGVSLHFNQIDTGKPIEQTGEIETYTPIPSFTSESTASYTSTSTNTQSETSTSTLDLLPVDTPTSSSTPKPTYTSTPTNTTTSTLEPTLDFSETPTETQTEIITGTGTDIYSDLATPLYRPPTINEELIMGDEDVSVESATWYVSTTGDDTNDCVTTTTECASINGVLAKAGFIDGDIVKVADGTYTGSGTEVVMIEKSIELLGGWNNDFSAQEGLSKIDGENSRRGIYVNGSAGIVKIDRFWVTKGHSTIYGAGFIAYDAGEIFITNSSFTNNNATGSAWGGGVTIVWTSLKISNSTISDNTTEWDGAGLYLYGTDNADINNVTITNNTSLGYGGGLFLDAQGGPFPISIQNTVIAGNIAVNGNECFNRYDNYGSISTGYNFFQSTDYCNIIVTTGDQVGGDPLFGSPLAGNPSYYPLISNSPLIDAGNPITPNGILPACESTDQLGVARPINGGNSNQCDIGAIEYSVPGSPDQITYISGTNQAAVTEDSYSNPLAAMVLDVDSNPIPGITVTFSAPGSGASGIFATSGNNIDTAITDQSGIATSSSLTANLVIGSFQVVASIAETSDQIIFDLENTIQPTPSMWYVSTTGDDTNDCATTTTECASINGVLAKAGFVAGDIINVAEGTYIGSGGSVVLIINIPTNIIGGWNSSFSSIVGRSTFDGENSRKVFYIYGNDNPLIKIDNLVIRNGLGDLSAGGVDNAATLILTNSIVENNISKRGAGISNGGNLIMIRSLVQNNWAELECAGCDNNGGGIYNSGELMIVESAVVGNHSTDDGGGIYGTSGNINIINSTISNNYAGNANSYGEGGGIKTSIGSYLAIYSSTITENYARENGGGIFLLEDAIIKNSIIYGNSTGNLNPNCYIYQATFTSAGYNIADSSCITATTGDQLSSDPLLGVLIGYPGHHSLASNSPAIDMGNPIGCTVLDDEFLTTDQRGVSRVGNCDIGAFEYITPGPATYIEGLSGFDQNTSPENSFSEPLNVVVLDANYSPIPGITVTFTAPGSGASAIFADTSINVSSSVTDQYGIATSSTFSANDSEGNYIVVASTTGISSTIDFPIINNYWYVSTTGNDSNNCMSINSECSSLDGVLEKSNFVPGDKILIEAGTYINHGGQNSVSINVDAILVGGWNNNFSSKIGFSTLDGEEIERVVYIADLVEIQIENFIIMNGNLPWDEGAGILVGNNALVTLKNVSILNNYAFSSGGGIYNNGNIDINNGTISGNRSNSSGGGIFNLFATLDLNNVTITNNEAGLGGGGISNFSGPIILSNTLIGENIADSGNDCDGEIGSLGHNLIGDTSGCTLNSNTGDLKDVSAGIGSLVGTPAFHPLVASSLAVNAGNPATPNSGAGTCESTDQRGISRNGTCDIGSFEYTIPGDPGSINRKSEFSQIVVSGEVFEIPFEVKVLDSSSIPVPGITVTFTAPENGASGIFSNTANNITTSVTDQYGIATSAIFTSNAVHGTYTVSASTSGVVGTVDFELNQYVWYVSQTGDDTNDCLSTTTECASIDGAIAKIGFIPGGTVKVAEGTYSGGDISVITIDKSANLSGGWDLNFLIQEGYSIIDGEHDRYTLLHVEGGDSVNVNGFIFENGWNQGNVRAWNSDIVFENIIIQGGIGGGLYVYNSNIEIWNSSVNDNRTNPNDEGGGIYINDFNDEYKTIIINSSINNNSAEKGGGIYMRGGLVEIINSTISNNSADYGGGIYHYDSSKIIIKNSTISYNSATIAAGGVYQPLFIGYPLTEIQNSILANNINNDCGSARIKSYGNNIFGNSSYCIIDSLESDQIDVDPLIVQLVGNPAFHPLSPISPAIDNGNSGLPGTGGSTCEAYDQNGLPRTVCDIGAVEFNGTGTEVAFIYDLIGNNQSSVILNRFFFPLQAIVIDPGGRPVPGITVNFLAPSSGASGVFSDTISNSTTAITNANGIAIPSIFTANNIKGNYVVSASAIGSANQASFNLENGLSVSGNRSTYDINNSTDDRNNYYGQLLCTEIANPCTNGNDTHADAAHLYAGQTHSFYLGYHGRDSFDDYGSTIISTVHYGTGIANAFWDGIKIIYGDAYGYAQADDVVAHEFTHGVTQYTSNLLYYYQSGAINESFSDLWGEFVDLTNGVGSDTAGDRWLMGEDVSGSGPIRDMEHPPTYGDPDTMSSWRYYLGSNDNGGVHTNSGVNNKAVYLMTDGGSFNGYTIIGLGITKVVAIYYEVQTSYLTSGSDYKDLYFAVYQSCLNLVGGAEGITSNECDEVKKAVDAVEMNEEPSLNYNPEANVCGVGEIPSNYFYDDFEDGIDNWIEGDFGSGGITWVWANGYAANGTQMLWGKDYSGIINSYVTMKDYVVIPSGPMYLHFNHAFGFEANATDYFDGGFLEYKILNEGVWTDATSLYDSGQNYNGTLFDGFDNPNGGIVAFIDDSHGYVSSRYDLSSLAGKSVNFRWRVSTDSTVSEMGWMLDDVRIYNCVVPPVSTWYLAEGYTGGGFGTFILIQNPNNEDANVTLTYMLQGGGTIEKNVVVSANSRYTVVANDENQVGIDQAFSTRLDADQEIIVERAMYWPNGDGSTAGHVTTGVTTPELTWYLAEGYTGGEFGTYILIQNPNNVDANVTLTYMLQGGGIVEKQVLVSANSRYTVVAHDESQVGVDQAFSTRLDSDEPIIAERAMYFNNDGHAAVGITTPVKTWYLAEGFTGVGFGTYILIQNPNDLDANVTLTYMIQGGGIVEKQIIVSANSRYTVVAHDIGQIGIDQAFSTRLDSDQSIIVERAMYWPNGDGTTAGHDSPGVSSPAYVWNLAEGYTGGGFGTYILIQNPNDVDATVTLTYMIQGGGTVDKIVVVPANGRFTVVTHDPEQVGVDQAFSTQLVSDQLIIVERAMYFNNGGHDTNGVPQID